MKKIVPQIHLLHVTGLIGSSETGSFEAKEEKTPRELYLDFPLKATSEQNLCMV